MGGRVSQHHNTFACVSNHAYMLVCMYSKFLHAQAHILSHLGKNTDMKVPMETREHAWHVKTHNVTSAHKLWYIYTLCLFVWAHNSVILDPIAEIKIFV